MFFLFTVASSLREIKRQSLLEIADIQDPEPLLAALVQAGLVKPSHQAEIRALLDQSRLREAMAGLCCHLLLMNDNETQIFFGCLTDVQPEFKSLLERQPTAVHGKHSGIYTSKELCVSLFVCVCVYACVCVCFASIYFTRMAR